MRYGPKARAVGLVGRIGAVPVVDHSRRPLGRYTGSLSLDWASESGRNGFRRLRTCADGIPSVQRSSAATAGTAGPASVFEHAVRTPIELAPLLDRAPKVTPSTSFPPTHPLSWRRFRVGLRCHPHGLGVEYDIGICIVLYRLLLLET